MLRDFFMAMKDTYPFIPDISTFDFFYFCFHCWIPPVFMIVSILIGYGRIYEGKGGRVIKGWFTNEALQEALQQD